MKADGFTPRPWTPALRSTMMDKAGSGHRDVVACPAAVMDSMSERSEKSRSLARQSNEYGAQLVRDHPGRFGIFAALPLPDADASLKEISYANGHAESRRHCLVDELHGQVGWRSRVLAGLRRVESAETLWCFIIREGLLLPQTSWAIGILEYDIDTARAIDSLLWNGTLSKFPNVRHIFSHSGGAFTVLAARIMDDFPKNRADKVPNGVEYEIKKLYFDTAHASKAPALDALKDIVPVSQIM